VNGNAPFLIERQLFVNFSGWQCSVFRYELTNLGKVGGNAPFFGRFLAVFGFLNGNAPFFDADFGRFWSFLCPLPNFF
jgi:hypothetical protein